MAVLARIPERPDDVIQSGADEPRADGGFCVDENGSFQFNEAHDAGTDVVFIFDRSARFNDLSYDLCDPFFRTLSTTEQSEWDATADDTGLQQDSGEAHLDYLKVTM